MGSTEHYIARERAALEKRIEKLNDENKRLVHQIERLKKYEKGGRYYHRMMGHIRDYEAIRDAWKEFITLYMLALPDIKELDEFTHYD